MKSLSATKVQQILSLIDLHQSTRDIATQTGVHYSTISRIRKEHCPDYQKPSPGCPSKLSPATARHAVRLITTGKAENASQVAKYLQDDDNITLSWQTISRGLREAGLKAVVKKKRPLLQARHIKERYHFAERHRAYGLARSVPFQFADITLYLQVHIVPSPAYDILVGQPFDILTESHIKNYSNEEQSITITDPNARQVTTIPTLPRGYPQCRAHKEQVFWERRA